MAAQPATVERATAIARLLDGEFTSEDMSSWPEAYLFACSIMDRELTYEKAAEVMRRWSLATVKAAASKAATAPEAPIQLADYAEAKQATKAVQPGFYTVVFSPAPDDYVTLRITQWSSRVQGHCVVSYLCGPDNGNDYVGFADVSPEGAQKVWKRFQGGYEKQQQAAAILYGAGDLSGFQEAYAMKSKRCAMCGRQLTVPASLHRGLGPECAKK